MKSNYVLYLLIALGGFIGAALHKCVEQLIPSLPGTLFANVVGCVFIGIFMYESIYIGAFSREARLFFGVGMTGSFTSFSTLAVETFLATPHIAVMNIITNLLMGLSGIYIGRYLITYKRGI
ncbi:CrcB protein [Methanocalculus alkaliphilus]|uniref:CrcB family protein n=1 Tax=Methanocalculus alkaliphilus TaxID=768730 RepID=UPI00209F9B77|nr:CrcB family protein [Methanocalculus alkaliphilus]MCP1714767.1 CrcB protein [Methanocalculus alkaliphilus]